MVPYVLHTFLSLIIIANNLPLFFSAPTSFPVLDLKCKDSGEKHKVFKISLQIPVLKLLTVSFNPWEMNFLCIKIDVDPNCSETLKVKSRHNSRNRKKKIIISNNLNRNSNSSYNKDLKIFQGQLPYAKKSHDALQIP